MAIPADAGSRESAFTRDGSLARISKLTWRVGAAAVAGTLLLMAGFANALPIHLPHFSAGQNGGGSGASGGSSGSGNSGNSGSSGGLQGPGIGPGSGSSDGSGQSQVRSGGS
jgi:hypothetical protein